MTDSVPRKRAQDFLDEIQSWDPENILIEPTKYDVSIKVSGRVFAYLNPRRKHFMVSTYDTDGDWKGFSVKSDDDLVDIKQLVRNNYEKLRQ